MDAERLSVPFEKNLWIFGWLGLTCLPEVDFVEKIQ